MRAKNTGTFDRTTKTWRIKTKRIQVSIRQLSQRFGVEIEPSKKASLPWWRRYLQELEESDIADKKLNSPLQLKIHSLERQIARLKQEGRDTSELELQLSEAINVPPHDIDFADHVVFHPDVEAVAKKIGFGGQDFYPKMLLESTLLPSPPIKKQLMLRDEIVSYLNRKSPKQAKNERRILNLFLETTGNIPLGDVSVLHYRKIHDLIKESQVSDRTKYNHFDSISTFLARMEQDHGLNFPFIRNTTDYSFRKPKGQRIQWTLPQVQFALDNTDGLLRLYLLLGLNCGLYVGDIQAMTPDMVIDSRLVKPRQKNITRDETIVGSWLLWDETLAVLSFGFNVREVSNEFRDFRLQHDLPEHKNLRKTVAQIIQDKVGEEESRLYRCENVKGVHGSHYINSFTPEQIAKLDSALRVVHSIIFPNHTPR